MNQYLPCQRNSVDHIASRADICSESGLFTFKFVHLQRGIHEIIRLIYGHQWVCQNNLFQRIKPHHSKIYFFQFDLKAELETLISNFFTAYKLVIKNFIPIANQVICGILFSACVHLSSDCGSCSLPCESVVHFQ